MKVSLKAKRLDKNNILANLKPLIKQKKDSEILHTFSE